MRRLVAATLVTVSSTACGPIALRAADPAPPAIDEDLIGPLKAMRRLDSDGDGRLTPAEHKDLLPPEVRARFGRDGNTVIDLSAGLRLVVTDFTTAQWAELARSSDQPLTTAEAIAFLGQARTRGYDSDGDGKLRFQEVVTGRETELGLALGLKATGASPASPTPQPEGDNPLPPLLVFGALLLVLARGVRGLARIVMNRYRSLPVEQRTAKHPAVAKARMYLRQNLVKPAIACLQEALEDERDPAIQSELRVLLAICFARRSEWVAVGLHRRALDPTLVQLDDLYELAGLLESGAQLSDLKDVLEQAVARNVGFRDVERRLKVLVRSGSPPPSPGPAESPAPAAPAGGDASFREISIERLLPPRYRNPRLIGEGGMARVFLAEDATLGRPVAIKILGSTFTPGISDVSAAELKKRFLREGRALAKLDHPGVVRVHDVSETDPPFMVMEYLPGEDLEQVLSEGGLEPARAVALFGQMARALAAIHANGIIHRDLKPANIRCPSDGPARIVDFGLAHSAELTSLTRADVRMGTLAYMAPEHLADGTFDESTDLFSLGVTFYQVFTGKRPYGLSASLHHPDPTPIHELREGVPRAICDAVMRMIQVRPEARMRSSRELVDVLDRVASRAGEPPLLARLEELVEGPLHSLKGALEELRRQSGPTGAQRVLGSADGLEWLRVKLQSARELIGPLLADHPEALGAAARTALTGLSHSLAEVWNLGLSRLELPPLERLEALLNETSDGIRLLSGVLRSHSLTIDEALLEGHRARSQPLEIRWTGMGRELVARHPAQVRAALDEILGNIVSNSRGVGARSLTIQMSDAENDSLALRMEDDGPGFGHDDPEKPFQRGFTDRAGGTGLGLARSRGQARALGGELAIDAPSRPGARLILTLPRMV